MPRMEPPKRFELNYSLKNIPIPSRTDYLTRLIEKVESVIKRMRWRAFFFLKSDQSDTNSTEEHFGFKSRKCPPRVEELQAFEEDLLEMVESVQFRPVSDDFQQQLRKDTARIKDSKDIIVPADKTRNLYTVSQNQYNKLMHNNITKNYKVAPAHTYDNINLEAQRIASEMKIDDRMESMAKKEAYVTLKYHKENFAQALPCRLINPAKTEIGVLSKKILDNIVTGIHKQLRLNTWKSTADVTSWFTRIKQKQSCSFVCFDIVDFYPSITEQLLRNALDFASRFCNISQKDKDTIFHARQSMLFGLDKEWTKKGTGLFDVTMGCFDGAEVCQLVGTFALSTLSDALQDGDIGLYRDDGLGAFWNLSGSEADRVRKNIIRIFDKLGLKITIQTNLKAVNYLDVTMDLATGKYYPYRKPGDRPLYVHRKSNHPPQIIKNIPAAISRRLTDTSSDEQAFSQAKPIYANALKESGYTEEVQYCAARKNNSQKKSKNRKRNVIWFNPPFSKSVSTNIGRKFRNLISKHFPKASKLNKIFNKNTLKISYSCMPSMAATIQQHNNRILRRQEPENQTAAHRRCNCRVKKECPLAGECLTKSVVYKATVETDNDRKEYIGMTATTFKERYNNHQQSMRHRRYAHSTTLSKHIWALKDANKAHSVTWSIQKRAASYTNQTKRCNLCLAEKLAIAKADKTQALNSRTELVAKCRHENRFYLQNFSSGTT